MKTMTTENLIARSVSHNEIARADWTKELEAALVAAAEDYVRDDDREVLEAWGTTDDGDEWRVHLDMKGTTMTTKKNITTGQISGLRGEAYASDDHLMGAVCDLALDGEIDVDDYTTLSAAEARKVGSMTQDEAIEMVVAAINEGQG